MVRAVSHVHADFVLTFIQTYSCLIQDKLSKWYHSFIFKIIDRAKQILKERESENKNVIPITNQEVKIDTNANVAEIVNVLKEMDMDNISPLMAFGTLQNLVDKVKK